MASTGASESVLAERLHQIAEAVDTGNTAGTRSFENFAPSGSEMTFRLFLARPAAISSAIGPAPPAARQSRCPR